MSSIGFLKRFAETSNSLAPRAPSISGCPLLRCIPGSKLEAQKVEVDVQEVAAPVHILAVDDLRLLRMQHQLADREAIGNRVPESPRLLGAEHPVVAPAALASRAHGIDRRFAGSVAIGV